MIDPVAASFERVAAEYDFGRPSWPPEAVASLGLSRTAVVVDLGAGTGKLTRALLGEFERVIAVEPLDGMRALVPAGADALAGTAEAIPLPDESADAVCCGESFHWFDWRRALPEIARVLRPGGTLALFWNRPRKGTVFSVTWPPGVSEVLDRVGHSPGERRYQSYAWRAAFAESPFDRLRFRTFPHEEEITATALLARIASWSQFASMPADRREPLLAEISGQLTAPTYEVRLETHVWTTRLAS